MTDFLNKISIYDQLGYLAVGGLFFIFFDYDLSFFGLDLKKLTENAFGIGVAVYFLGHVAQGIANLIIKEKSSPCDPVLIGEIKQRFGIEESKDSEAFKVCYLWALSVDKTGHVEAMNARYGLYRGWFSVLVLQTCFYSFIVIRDLINCQFQLKIYIGIVFTTFTAWLMHNRSKRFYKLIADKTFETYVIHRNTLNKESTTK